ncbi:hypothetical protein G9A89_001532 [Geosiphon pyriformis]|nr:hypothetical protein G9A89_001532 [Geosiphon pyriformis]
MVLDSPDGFSNISLPVATDSLILGSSSSKVITSKLNSLESKFVALENCHCLQFSMNSLVWKVATCNIRGMNNLVKQNDIICWHKKMNNMISIVTETKLKGRIRPWIMNKFDSIWVFTSGLNSGHLNSRVAIIMNNFLAQHICKVLDISSQFFFFRLLFKNNLSVLVLRLYARAFLAVHFSQADNVNSFITKAVNESSFVILGGDFNKDGSHKSTSFKKCFDLGLGVVKTIDYVFVLLNLVNAILDHDVTGVGEFFDTDHRAVFVSSKFKDEMVANAAMLSNNFLKAKMHLDLGAMWDAVHKTLCYMANVVFKKKWFKAYDSVFTKISFRFHRLELLVSKLVKASWLIDCDIFTLLLEIWILLDSVNASLVKSLFLSGSPLNDIHSVLLKIRKFYCASKLLELKYAEDSYIKSAINRRMESFESDKDHTIRIVLDHLVVDKKLILEPDLVKNKVDEIMESWMRKRGVVRDPLEHVFDGAFSNVMDCVSFVELFGVVSNLPDGKAAGLSGISNELWKHCDDSALNMLLVLINSCLSNEFVPGA